jgi:flagellar motor switch protein FliM
MLRQVFADLREAWSPVWIWISNISRAKSIRISPTSSARRDIVVVSRFKIDLEGGSGHLHVTIPYSMIEPIREQLDAGLQSDRAERDERWTQALEQQIKDTEVAVESQLATATISLRQLMNLKAGDVLPINMPKTGGSVRRGHAGFSRHFRRRQRPQRGACHRRHS